MLLLLCDVDVDVDVDDVVVVVVVVVVVIVVIVIDGCCFPLLLSQLLCFFFQRHFISCSCQIALLVHGQIEEDAVGKEMLTRQSPAKGQAVAYSSQAQGTDQHSDRPSVAATIAMHHGFKR